MSPRASKLCAELDSDLNYENNSCHLRPFWAPSTLLSASPWLYDSESNSLRRCLFRFPCSQQQAGMQGEVPSYGAEWWGDPGGWCPHSTSALWVGLAPSAAARELAGVRAGLSVVNHRTLTFRVTNFLLPVLFPWRLWGVCFFTLIILMAVFFVFSLSLSMACSKQNFSSLHTHILRRRIFPKFPF